LDIHELGEMYVPVELHEDVRQQLAAHRARKAGSQRAQSRAE
jgi:hypothetical protein